MNERRVKRDENLIVSIVNILRFTRDGRTDRQAQANREKKVSNDPTGDHYRSFFLSLSLSNPPETDRP